MGGGRWEWAWAGGARVAQDGWGRRERSLPLLENRGGAVRQNRGGDDGSFDCWGAGGEWAFWAGCG